MVNLVRLAFIIGAAARFAGCGGSPGLALPTKPMSQLQNRAHDGNGYKVLYSFTAGTDGEYPSGGLAPVKMACCTA